WRELLEKLQPFSAQTIFEQHEAGGVAARPGEAIDQAGADRIDNAHENDRQSTSDLLQRRHARGPAGEDDVRCERNQFGRVFAMAVGIVFAPADVDPRTAVATPAQLL